MQNTLGRLRRVLVTNISRVGQAMPRRLQHRIAGFPGILKFLEKLSKTELMEVLTPEGHSLVINPLFHSAFTHADTVRGYEPDTRKIISKFTKPGMVAYDVGANVGVFSFLFATIVGEEGIVYSFEPEENNYRCFEKSLEKYGGSNIVLDKRAVGKTKSTGKFARRGGAFSGRLIGDGPYSTTRNIRTVETVSIDHLVKEEGYRVPDILKIDVEGNEGMVLEGMRGILEAYSPMVLWEVHTHLGESADPITKLLSFYGYTVSGVKKALAETDLGNRISNSPMESHVIAVKFTDRA